MKISILSMAFCSLSSVLSTLKNWEWHDSRRTAVAILILLTLINIIAYGPRSIDRGSDFRMFYTVAGDVFSNDNLYEKHAEFMYLPIFPLLIHPFSWVSQSTALILWFLLNILLFTVAFPMSASVTSGRIFPPYAAISFFLCMGFLAQALRSNLKHGNSNVIILFLIVLGLVLYRRRHDISAGAVFGLAATLKITPALFIVYLAARSSYRAVLAALLTVMMLVFIVPSAILGPHHNIMLLRGFYIKMMYPYLETVEVPHVHPGKLQEGQSLPVAANLLFTDTYNKNTGNRIHLIALSPAVVQIGSRIIAVLLVMGLLALGWRRRANPRNGVVFGSEAALVICTMLVVSGISRTGHFVILIFPLTHFLLLSWSEGTTKKIRCITQRTLLTMLILFLGIALLTDILAVPFKSLVPYFFITVTLGLGCLLLTQHVDTDPDIEQL